MEFLQLSAYHVGQNTVEFKVFFYVLVIVSLFCRSQYGCISKICETADTARSGTVNTSIKEEKMKK